MSDVLQGAALNEFASSLCVEAPQQAFVL